MQALGAAEWRQTVNPLCFTSFREFFQEIYGYAPFPWQERLAAQASAGSWPACLALPTASGKTACIDIAVFALACQAQLPPDQRTAPRRIFFVVDRRVIVDEAFERARRLADKLAKAQGGVCLQVATALRHLAGVAPGDNPLDTCQLRGGIYRDDAWVRSPLQPTVIASTVDQIGSRLLFRGYGVSDSARPIHAALIANDSLLILDEAHCAQPFRETLAAVQRYRGSRWVAVPLAAPFHFVEMSATPRDGQAPFRLDSRDAAEETLRRRQQASKLAKLVPAEKAKGKNACQELAKILQAQAEEMIKADPATKAVAIIVNRVRTARLLHEDLSRKYGGCAHLLIGRMRPLDRDRLTAGLQAMFASGADRGQLAQPHFVVATQCLEVGADFDFDAMVCECASLDALRQRFGRLNRLGRPLATPAAVVIAAQNLAPKEPDPVYGEALPRTWEWLQQNQVENHLDFGIASFDKLWQAACAADPGLAERLQAPAPHAPVMLPAHLDCWCQTSPAPVPDPDVAIFLHGPDRGQPEVQVCWRADLPSAPDAATWTHAVSLCPPVSTECLAVPLWLCRRWLADVDAGGQNDFDSDLLDGAVPETSARPAIAAGRLALAWRGPDHSQLITDASAIRPGDTLVFPVTAGGWAVLGHLPEAPADPAEGHAPAAAELACVDLGTQAYRQSRGKALLRLHPALWPQDSACAGLRAWAANPEDEGRLRDLRELLQRAAAETTDAQLADTCRQLARVDLGLVVERYAGQPGAVLQTRRRLPPEPRPEPSRPGILAQDDGDDAVSGLDREHPVPLAEHLAGVAACARRLALSLGLPPEPLALAGQFHDLGKADPRFQAYLLQGTLAEAGLQPRLWAKHPQAPASYEEHRRATARSGRPEGQRHELLSVALLQDRLRANLPQRDLLLHLLAAHHGYCRPFAPISADTQPTNVSVTPAGHRPNGPGTLTLSASTATGLERLDSGIPERFWQLTRSHGWWGLAYLEALLRLADWQRSDEESRGIAAPVDPVPEPTACLEPARIQAVPACQELLLPGLDGANPLAFLAALGTLRTLTLAWPDRHVKMSWRQHAGAWRPVLHASGQLGEELVLEALHTALAIPFHEHPVAVIEKLKGQEAQRRVLFVDSVQVGSLGETQQLLWLACLSSDLGEDPTSPLQTVRRDYLVGNLKSIIGGTTPAHLLRTLFRPWDHADALDNQSLHWDPSEDRRYAYQWHQPSGDPNRKKQGGMLGANRLAIEALPLHPLIVNGPRPTAVGFTGTNSSNTRWTWPIWNGPLPLDAIAALLQLPELQHETPGHSTLSPMAVATVYRSRRILVNKTINLTPALTP